MQMALMQLLSNIIEEQLCTCLRWLTCILVLHLLRKNAHIKNMPHFLPSLSTVFSEHTASGWLAEKPIHFLASILQKGSQIPVIQISYLNILFCFILRSALHTFKKIISHLNWVKPSEFLCCSNTDLEMGESSRII